MVEKSLPEEAPGNPVSLGQGERMGEAACHWALSHIPPLTCGRERELHKSSMASSSLPVSTGQGAVGAPARPAAFPEYHHPQCEAGGRAGPLPRSCSPCHCTDAAGTAGRTRVWGPRTYWAGNGQVRLWSWDANQTTTTYLLRQQLAHTQLFQALGTDGLHQQG